MIKDSQVLFVTVKCSLICEPPWNRSLVSIELDLPTIIMKNDLLAVLRKFRK